MFIVVIGRDVSSLRYIGGFLNYESAEHFAATKRKPGMPAWVAEIEGRHDHRHSWQEADTNGIEQCLHCGEERTAR